MVATRKKWTATTSYLLSSSFGKGDSRSWILNITFLGQLERGGNASGEISNPVRVDAKGRDLATSRSQMPVPVAMSATLRKGDECAILVWMRSPKMDVVIKLFVQSVLNSQISIIGDG